MIGNRQRGTELEKQDREEKNKEIGRREIDERGDDDASDWQWRTGLTCEHCRAMQCTSTAVRLREKKVM